MNDKDILSRMNSWANNFMLDYQRMRYTNAYDSPDDDIEEFVRTVGVSRILLTVLSVLSAGDDGT